MIVYKLGGTSQCIKGYNKIIDIIKNNINSEQIFIVLSAVSGVTNELVKFTETKDLKHFDKVVNFNKKLISDINNFVSDTLNINSDNLLKYLNKYKEALDILYQLCYKFISEPERNNIYNKSEIIGYGEILSTNIFSYYLKILGLEHELLNSYNYIYSKKEIYQLNTQTEFYCKEFDINLDKKVYILQGFICSTPSGKKIILGRGGSDTTGSLVAKSIRARLYEVWTDVDGIFTGDPRIFPYTYVVNNINYNLCQEISAMGAKVMHPLSIKPCADANIPICVKNTFSEAEGTIISSRNERNDVFYAIQKNQTVFKIKSLDMWNSYGFITDIFRQFSDNKIDINIVTTSQFSISATTSENDIYKLQETRDYLLEKYEVEMINNCYIISFICNNIKDNINNFEFKEIKPEIIHISDNNMTLNIVIKEFDPNIINKFCLI